MNRIDRDYDAVVLLGFGGPTKPEEIRPFLDRVLRGRRIPAARYEEVVGHYMHVGGSSPYNALTQRLAVALTGTLQQRGIDVPVEVAYRNAEPFIEDTFQSLVACGAQRVFGIVLAAHRSDASWDRYVRSADEARSHLRAGALEVEYAPVFFDHPLFVRAQASRVREAMERLGETTLERTALIFTAHSIPQAMADRSPYVQQLRRSAELVATIAGMPSWELAYQSRSGLSEEQWLEPDIRDVLRRPPESGMRNAIVVPIGFLCDHVEVLYDLDADAAEIASKAGVRMERAGALNDHPLFVEMLADLILARN